MKKEVVIQKAREFAQKSLIGNIENVSREDYYIFLISKFLLLKEMIIKKDTKENVLHFNYNKYKEYLPAIKYIVDCIKENGTIEKNSTTVIIEPPQYNNSDLQFYIWTFNKIRDSLAHGMYEFDLNNEQLIIKNDHSNSRDPYVLNCVLSIEMLEFFTYVIKKPKLRYSAGDIAEFQEQNKKVRSIFECLQSTDSKIINNYNKYNYMNKNIYNVSNIEENSYNLDNQKYLKNSYNVDNKKINYNIYEYSKQQEDNLDVLLVMIENSDKFTEEQKQKLYAYLRRLGLLNLNINIDKSRIKRNKHPDRRYAKKLTAVISEVSSILGLKGKPNNMITIAAIYNYMQLTFSLNEFNFNVEKENLGYLKISELHPKYVKFNENVFVENDQSQYAYKVNSIQTFTKNFVLKMNERIEQYKNNPSSSFRQSINDLFKNYYDSTIQFFADKNALILTSIRNSIEHANVHDVNGQIILNDQSNQNDNQSINFYCYGSASQFFEITNALESGIVKDNFTFDDFLNELKLIVDISSFNDILSIIEKLKAINAEALVSVLNQAIPRK